jgi:hypothetical protein
LPQDARKEGLKAKIHTYPLFGGVFVFSHWLNHLESTKVKHSPAIHLGAPKVHSLIAAAGDAAGIAEVQAGGGANGA